jgi:hypothetical protein
MRQLLSGCLVVLGVVAALHFVRFGHKTGDVFFHLFGSAFLLLAINSLVLGLADADDRAPALYLIRLAAFGLILASIYTKNRE